MDSETLERIKQQAQASSELLAEDALDLVAEVRRLQAEVKRLQAHLDAYERYVSRQITLAELGAVLAT